MEYPRLLIAMKLQNRSDLQKNDQKQKNDTKRKMFFMRIGQKNA